MSSVAGVRVVEFGTKYSVWEVLEQHRVRSLSIDHPQRCRATVARSRSSSRRLPRETRAMLNDVTFESRCRRRLIRVFAGGPANFARRLSLPLSSLPLPTPLLSPRRSNAQSFVGIIRRPGGRLDEDS